MTSTPRIDAPELAHWWDGIADILIQEARHADSEADNLRLLMDAARVKGEECSDLAGANALYLEAQALSPRDPRILRALVEISNRLGDWVKVKEWLECCIAEEQTPKGRTGLKLELAEVLAMRLGERSEALETLWSALDETPQMNAALLMVALFLNKDDLEGRAELLKRRLVMVEDGATRLNVLLQLGRLEGLRGGQTAASLAAFKEAYELDNTCWDAVIGVYRCLLESADWPALQRFLADALPSLPTSSEGLRLRLILETLQSTHFGETSGAAKIHALESALAMDLNARLELSQLGDAGGTALATDVEGRGVLRARLHYQSGLIYERQRAYEAAADAYELALKACPAFVIAHHAQRRTTAKLGDTSDYVVATEAIAEITEDPGLRSSLYTHLGMHYEFSQGQTTKAADFYDRAVGAHLSAIGGPPVHEIPALNDLVRALEATMDHDDFDKALGNLIQDCAEPNQVAWLYDRRAELALTKKGDTDRALEFYGQAADLDPENLHAHRVRQDVFRRRRDWSSLLAAIEAELKEAQGTRRLQLLSQLADIHLQLGAPSAAEAAWRQALDEDSNWFPAHIGLGQLLDGQGRWRELGEQLAYQLATLEGGPGQRTALLGRLAEIYEFRLDLPDRAEAAYLELLELKGAAPDAIAGLERVYAQSGKWGALVEVLEGYAVATSDAEAKAAIHVRIADLLHVHLSDLEGAIENYRSAVALWPQFERANWGLEWVLMESGDRQALAAHYIASPKPESQDGATLQLHKRLIVAGVTETDGIAQSLLDEEPSDHLALWARVVGAAERGDDPAIASALTNLADHVDAREIRTALLVEAAERLSKDEREQRAKIWEQIIQASPDNERGWQALLTVYSGSESGADLRDYLYRLQDSISHKGSRSTAYWMAAMLSDALGHNDRALEELRRAYEICPDDVIPLWLMLHRGAYRDTTEQATLMERLAVRMVDRAEAAQLFYEAGRIRIDKLHDQHQAASDFQAALLADPSLQAAADQLEQVLIGQDRLDELLELSLQRAKAAKDPELKASLLLRSARSERRLNGRPERAILLLEELLTTSPGNETALREIADTLVELGRSAEAIGHYETLIEQADDESALGNAYLELGRLKIAMGNCGEEAVELYRRAVSVSASPAALIGLGDAYLSIGDFDLAQLTFRRLERMDLPGELGLSAVLGQVEALLAAERPAEALRRIKRTEIGEVGQDSLGRAARILATFPELPTPLHQRLSDVLTARGAQGVAPVQSPPTIPMETAPRPDEFPSADSHVSGHSAGEPSLYEQSGSGVMTMTGYAIDVAGDTSASSLRTATQPEGIVERLTSPQTWLQLADEYPTSARWYREIACWTEGQVSAEPLVAVVGPLPETLRLGARPADVPASLLQLVGRVIRIMAEPLALSQERAEVAAEGQQCNREHPLYKRLSQSAAAVGLDNAVLVRSAARPYTLDVFRKTPPVITFGSSLLDGLDMNRASFLIGATILPLVEGLLPPRYTAAGRALDDDRFEALFAAILSNLGCKQLVSDAAQPFVGEYEALINSVPIEGNAAELRTLAKQVQQDTAGVAPAIIRAGLDRYVTRLAAVMADSLGGALDALRQLDFDDRPRNALTNDHIRAIVRDNEVILDLLQFAQTQECRNLRDALRKA